MTKKASTDQNQTWEALPPPQTPSERTKYLKACQAHFTTIAKPKPYTPCCRVTRAVDGLRTEAPSFFCGDVSGPANCVFSCSCCDRTDLNLKEESKPIVINPYSELSGLLCKECHEKLSLSAEHHQQEAELSQLTLTAGARSLPRL